jgi:regulator of protease activity HflC (stomatin/prohibitin superfamily)
MIAEDIPIRPVRLVLGLIACVGIVVILFTLLFGFRTIPANSVGVKTRFDAYHDLVNPGLTYAIPYVNEILIVPTQRLLKLELVSLRRTRLISTKATENRGKPRQ